MAQGYGAWHEQHLRPAGDGFGAAFRGYRIAAGMSTVSMSERLGCVPSYVSRLESGRRNPSIGLVLRIADALHLDRPETVRLLSLAGFIERPLTAEQAAIVAEWTCE